MPKFHEKIISGLNRIFRNIMDMIPKKKAIRNPAKGNTKEKPPPVQKWGFQPTKKQFVKKPKLSAQQRRAKLRYLLDKAGISLDEKVLKKVLFNVGIALNMLLSAYLLFALTKMENISIFYLFLIIILQWLFIFPLIYLLVSGIFYFAIDFRIYRRRFELEEVLPDFLQLTASNVRAGMMLDRALWYAVRPRFGILAKEIEHIAKETMAGTDIKVALTKFSDKYDSPILKRTISLILEGMNAGGNMGALLSRIAVDIEESRVMQKEMAANVSNYVIFISFASVVAAPVLFALSSQFIKITQKLAGSSTMPKNVQGMGLSFSAGGISQGDFRIFAMSSIIMTVFFAALIIGAIKKGDVRSSLKYIPVFIVIGLTIYFFVDGALGAALSSFF